ncbi:MAG TPA: hypothetical protein VJT74_05295 [Pyrinomonadaceae bacterium]|nr:hypothetical protein [Pyrinomonadaceae bacterium]
MKQRRLFFVLLPALSLFVLCRPAAHAQQVVAEGETAAFHISSLDTPFAMQGDFEGEYTVYPEAIRVRLTKALVRVGTHCPYKGRREFRAVSFWLATTNPETGKWKRAFTSQKHLVRTVMLPGDEYRFDGAEFLIPKEAATDLSRHWFVVEMEDVALEVPSKGGAVEGYAFANSCPDVFIKKEKP